MQINTDALMLAPQRHPVWALMEFFRSLQVFENESHASMHSDKTKEGLSLFSWLHFILLEPC